MAVYETFYSCRREPFSLSPDPNFLYAAEPHREALAQLRYLVQERKGFAVLTGEVGTGKTMLLRSLIESVGPEVQTGYVFNPPRSIDALYDAIGYELGITLTEVANPAAVLNRHLLSTYEDGGTVVLIFDEAQSLSIELLEEVRLLTNIETSSTKLAQVILAGQPEFDTMIDSIELRALRQRLVFRFSLAPLSLSETEHYIAARLGAAGAEKSPFTARACAAVHRYSSGVPRLVNVICDNALLGGFATDSPIIDEEQIVTAAGDLKLISAPRRIYQPPAAPNLPNVKPPRWKSQEVVERKPMRADSTSWLLEVAPEPGSANGRAARRALEPASKPSLANGNLAHRQYDRAPEPVPANGSHTSQVYQLTPEQMVTRLNHAAGASEADPDPTPAALEQMPPPQAYEHLPEPIIVRVESTRVPTSSNRNLVYSLVLVSMTVALILAVMVIATQGNTDNSNGVTEIQDMFRNTLRWLGSSARIMSYFESCSKMFGA